MSLTPRWGSVVEGDPVFPIGSPSAGLADFLQRLKSRSRPRLYDVGPAPGGNIVFFAGQGLRVYVDADRDHRIAGSAPNLEHLAEDDFDAALLWDLLDFLPTARAEAFVAELSKALKPGGLVFLLSSTSRAEGARPVHTYFVEAGGRLSARPVEGALASRIRRENREIISLFPKYENVSVHLLRSGMREILLKRR